MIYRDRVVLRLLEISIQMFRSSMQEYFFRSMETFS